jgi:competence protein ComFC
MGFLKVYQSFTLTLLAHAFDLLFPPSEKELLIRKATFEVFNALLEYKKVNSCTTALLPYRHPLVEAAIWELKYRKSRHSQKILGMLLYQEIIAEISEKMLLENFERPLIVPIPLSRKRLRERGFNQSKLLVEELVRLDSGNTFEHSDALVKNRHTPPQTRLAKTQRIENLKGCFAVTDKKKVCGRNIILIDDVVTTGSTLSKARNTLLKAGAKKVICFAVAH